MKLQICSVGSSAVGHEQVRRDRERALDERQAHEVEDLLRGLEARAERARDERAA